MANGPEVARGYVTIIPSMEGSQREITEELTGSTDAAAKVAGAKGGKSLAKSLAGGMSTVGGAMTKGITVPVIAAATASVAAWKSVDEAMDTVTTKTGASGAALEDMQSRASNLATSIPASFQEAGDAIGEVNTRFGLTGDNLETLSGQFIKFAKINGQDVSGSVDNVSKVLAAFGMDASQASGYLDALNVVGQKTGVDVGTLAQQVSANAAQFQQMGLSAADATNLLGQMSMAGLDSSTAMMGMKTAMKEAAADGTTMSAKLTEFQATMSSSASESDKLAAAYELFGTRAGGAIYNATAQGTLDLTNFQGSLQGFEGSVSTTFTETQDPLDRFTVVTNQLKEAGAGLVDAFGPVLADALSTVSDVLSKIADVWNGLSPGMQDAIVKVALIAAAIGPVVSGIAKVIGVVTTVHTLITTLTPALGVLNGVLLANPIGIVVAAIGGLIVAGVALYKNWDKVKAGASALWDGIKHVWSGITDTVKGAVDKLKGFLNFEWHLPSIKLPHFSISGQFSLNPPQIPHFSVDWYAKAMKNGMILNQPTIFGAANGSLLGGGEAGPEAVVGVDSLRGMIQDAVGESGGVTINVYAQPGQDVNELAQIIEQKISTNVRRRGAAFA